MSAIELLNEDCILDHIAIAVDNLDEAQKSYEALGLSFSSEREVVEDQGVVTAFAPVDENAHIELLGVIDGEKGEGAIKKFLEKKGPGIHHICFKVPDVNQKMKDLTSKGFKLIYDSPKKGANNCLVNFIHPKSTGGVLIEINQKLN